MSELRGQGFMFVLLSMLTGLCGAFIYPLMSYFLVDEIGSPPMTIGLYMVSVTFSGLFISQWMGRLADNGVSARKMYVRALVSMAIGIAIFANTQSFWVVLAAGVVFMGVGNATLPQMLTLSRQWAGQSSTDIAQFNAMIRAAISFAWIGGPPAAFALVTWIGFSGSFYAAIGTICIAIVFVYRFIPEMPKKTSCSLEEAKEPLSLSFWLLGTAIVMGALANIMYSSSLALYTIRELQLPSYTPGVLMGLVAALEIPVMLYASRLAKRFSKTHLIAVSFVFAMVFYAGIFHATTVWEFMCLQALNAVFYGLYAGLGLTLMQDQLPKKIGFTSAFYSNAMKVGMMLGSTGAGLIAQFYSFQYASLGSLSAAVIGLLSLLGFATLSKIQSGERPFPLSALAK